MLQRFRPAHLLFELAHHGQHGRHGSAHVGRMPPLLGHREGDRQNRDRRQHLDFESWTSVTGASSEFSLN